MTWNELIRPQTPQEIVGNDEFVRDAQEWERTGQYPSALLFVGEPGTGKSSAAHVIVRSLLGKYHNDMNVLWTNASDDRGIAYIREELKDFVRLRGIGVKRKPVVLDEADGLTPTAQDALRGIMEQYSESIVFILTANYGDKIRPAIKSRCTTYIFNRLSPEQGASHLHRLTESCGAPVDWTPYYGDVVKYHDGDLRAAINTLERIPKTADAIQRFVIEDNDDWWDYIPENKWNELRKQMLTLLDSTGDRMAFMNNFHRSTRKHFDTDADTTFAVMSVYGDMMRYVYEWGGSDISFVEVLVARLKKEIGE